MQFKPARKRIYTNDIDHLRIAWLSVQEEQSIDEIAGNLSLAKTAVKEYLDPKCGCKSGKHVRSLQVLSNSFSRKKRWIAKEMDGASDVKLAISKMTEQEADELIFWIGEWFDSSQADELEEFFGRCRFAELEPADAAEQEITSSLQDQDPFADLFEIKP